MRYVVEFIRCSTMFIDSPKERERDYPIILSVPQIAISEPFQEVLRMNEGGILK